LTKTQLQLLFESTELTAHVASRCTK